LSSHAQGTRPSDVVAVIEAAYRADADRRSWLQGLLDAFRSALDLELPGAAFTADFSNPLEPRFTTFVGTGLPDEDLKHVLALEDGEEINKNEWPLMVARPVLTLSQFTAEPRERPRFPILHPESRDALGVFAADPGAEVVVVCMALPHIARLSKRDILFWSRVSAHLATGWRLRNRLGDMAAPAEPDAVLDPDGRVLHAEGIAQQRGAREALRRAALALDRARGRLRRDDSFEAVRIWEGLVSGNWSLVDQFEGDGRRYVVARRNEPVPRVHDALTLRERQIVAYAALGHSNKLIAYELGIAVSTVAACLASAKRKFQVQTRVELIKAVGWGPPIASK
jgi:DNA-binding CsgD family transcriptional regulator